MVGLRWKDVDLVKDKLHVTNAIQENESVASIEYRLKNNIDRLKTEKSRRTLPMYKVYRDILESYRIAYYHHYGLDKDKLDKYFVFPNYNARSVKNRLKWQKQKNICRHLNDAIEKANIHPFEPYSFRHACCHFLLKEGMTEFEAQDYFGHDDSDMVREIYGNLSDDEKYARISVRMTRMMGDIDEDIKVKNDEYQSLLKRIYPNEDQPKARKERCKERLTGQIEYKIKKNDSVFYIDKEEEDIFD